MKTASRVLMICVIFSSAVTVAAGAEKAGSEPKTVEALYPRLAAGVLTFARVGELPDGVLMRADDIELRMEDVDKFIAKQQKRLRQQLKKDAFFALEQEATPRLLLQAAKKEVGNPGEKEGGREDKKIVDDYVNGLTEKVTVSEEDLIRFYKEKEQMFCNTPFEKIKGRLGPFVLKEKKERKVNEHIRTMGERMNIVVSASWVKEQAALARDNPVDKVRGNGRPTLAIFSAPSCCGPDRMIAVAAFLEKKHAERCNIVHISTAQNYVLTARYGVYSVPTHVFFDKAGKEVLRHAGLLTEQQFDDKLSQAGLK
ncbi:MAG: thioredoxin family protein [Planctomycetota bacterium]|jgi:thiol-disulfide isomerase/thioredoxin